MKVELRKACLSAAVVAVVSSGSFVRAADLIWDPAQSPTSGTDGTGLWDNSSLNFYNASLPATSNPVVFSSVTPDSVTFGSGAPTALDASTTTPTYAVLLNDNITVQNITLGLAGSGTTGRYYNILDQGDGNQTLTVNGNIVKTAALGFSQIQLANAMVLSAGNHIIATRDSPGDGAPELAFNSAITGSGSVTIDNTLNYTGPASDVEYGTTAFNVGSNYTGGTNVVNGRLISNAATGLGTGQVVVSGGGQLSFGGGGTTTGDQNIANAIQITRSDYTTANTNNRYTDAIIAANDGSNNTITLSGALDIASTDARISANTNTIVISSNIKSSTGTGVLTLDGDFAGFVTLTGNNSGAGSIGAAGGIKLIGGVELNVTNDNNLGGPNSALTFSGSATLHPVGGFLTSFGTHVINAATFSGGIDVDQGQTFTIANSLGTSGVNAGSVGKRGLGTLVLSGTNFLLGGQTFFDSGTINITGATTLASLHLRSPILNISQGGSITTTAGFNSLGQDSTGTNGGPDRATVNLTGNGALIQTSGDDFNFSDNANTSVVVNMSGTSVLTTGGITAFAKSAGATAVLNQSGGTTTINRNNNFGFVLGDRNGTGTYNLSGGTFNSVGETYVGEAAAGVGVWNQTGGVVNQNNWFVVGREGGLGTVAISGGTFNKTGGGNFSIGEGNNTRANSLTLSGPAILNDSSGEFWVANGGGMATMTVQDTASLSVNNWLAIGRGGGSIGVFNQTGGSVTKVAGSNGFLAIGSGGTGTYNQTGGTMNISGTRLGEASAGTLNISGGTDVFTNEFSVGYNGGTVGTLNISGTANVTVPGAVLGVTSTTATAGGVINLNGGTLSGASFTAGAATTELAQFNFNGGTLRPTATNTVNFVGAKVQSNVLAGGAIIDTNGFNAAMPTTLAHGGAAATDGGLTKRGLGTLTLTGANTYTGATVVAAGTLNASYSATATSASSPILTGPGGADIQNGQIVFNYTGSTTPAAAIRTALATSYASGFSTGQIRSTTATANRGLGYVDDGTSIVTVKATLYGDSDLNGKVDINDFNVLAVNFGKLTGQVWATGDFDYNGSTGINDFNLLAVNFGQSLATPSVAMTFADWQPLLAFAEAHNDLAGFEAATGVPEPTTLAMAAVGAAVALRRRRTAVTA